MRIRMALMTAVVWVLFAPLAHAASGVVLLDVRAHVISNCRIDVTDMAFGSYDPLLANSNSDLDGTANLRVMCTKNARATVLLSETGSARALSFGDQRIRYEIFSDAQRTNIMAAQSRGLQFDFLGASSPRELKVYGRIPAGQVVTAGRYTDTVLATVDF